MIHLLITFGNLRFLKQDRVYHGSKFFDKGKFPMTSFRKLLGTASLLINLVPFLLYMLLVNRANAINTALPFAIYYAFRHTSLLFLRDWENDYQIMARIGIICGLIGYAIGVLGSINPFFYDLSAIGTGIASRTFPAALTQQNRLAKRNLAPANPSINPLLTLLIFFVVISAIVLLKNLLIISFTFMFLVMVAVMIGYSSMPKSKVNVPHSLHWTNYVLALILFCGMMMVRWGRSIDQGQPILLGVSMIILFLLVMIALLFYYHHQFIHYPLHIRARLMLYGVSAQYWTLYSTIFIAARYGKKIYYWIIIAYLLAAIFGGVLVKQIDHLFPTHRHDLNLIAISCGLLLTLYLPTYFVAVFIIRSFANTERSLAMNEFENTTHHYQTSYFNSNYHAEFGAIFSQLVLWISLYSTAGIKGINRVLIAFTTNQVTSSVAGAIETAHLALLIFMVGFVWWTGYQLHQHV